MPSVIVQAIKSIPKVAPVVIKKISEKIKPSKPSGDVKIGVAPEQTINQGFAKGTVRQEGNVVKYSGDLPGEVSIKTQQGTTVVAPGTGATAIVVGPRRGGGGQSTPIRVGGVSPVEPAPIVQDNLSTKTTTISPPKLSGFKYTDYAPTPMKISNVYYVNNPNYRPANLPSDTLIVYTDNQGRLTGETSNPNITVPKYYYDKEGRETNIPITSRESGEALAKSIKENPPEIGYYEVTEEGRPAPPTLTGKYVPPRVVSIEEEGIKKTYIPLFDEQKFQESVLNKALTKAGTFSYSQVEKFGDFQIKQQQESVQRILNPQRGTINISPVEYVEAPQRESKLAPRISNVFQFGYEAEKYIGGMAVEGLYSGLRTAAIPIKLGVRYGLLPGEVDIGSSENQSLLKKYTYSKIFEEKTTPMDVIMTGGIIAGGAGSVAVRQLVGGAFSGFVSFSTAKSIAQDPLGMLTTPKGLAEVSVNVLAAGVGLREGLGYFKEKVKVYEEAKPKPINTLKDAYAIDIIKDSDRKLVTSFGIVGITGPRRGLYAPRYEVLIEKFKDFLKFEKPILDNLATLTTTPKVKSFVEGVIKYPSAETIITQPSKIGYVKLESSIIESGEIKGPIKFDPVIFEMDRIIAAQQRSSLIASIGGTERRASPLVISEFYGKMQTGFPKYGKLNLGELGAIERRSIQELQKTKVKEITKYFPEEAEVSFGDVFVRDIGSKRLVKGIRIFPPGSRISRGRITAIQQELNKIEFDVQYGLIEQATLKENLAYVDLTKPRIPRVKTILEKQYPYKALTKKQMMDLRGGLDVLGTFDVDTGKIYVRKKMPKGKLRQDTLRHERGHKYFVEEKGIQEEIGKQVTDKLIKELGIDAKSHLDLYEKSKKYIYKKYKGKPPYYPDQYIDEYLADTFKYPTKAVIYEVAPKKVGTVSGDIDVRTYRLPSEKTQTEFIQGIRPTRTPAEEAALQQQLYGQKLANQKALQKAIGAAAIKLEKTLKPSRKSPAQISQELGYQKAPAIVGGLGIVASEFASAGTYERTDSVIMTNVMETRAEVTREFSSETGVTRGITREIPKEVGREIVREIPREITREIPREITREVPREIVREIQREIPRQISRQVTRQVTRSLVTNVPFTTTETITNRIIFNLDKKERQMSKLKKQKAYSVLLRRRGKFISVAAGLTRGRAILAGQRAALGGLGRTFKLVESGTTESFDIDAMVNQELFRGYKVRKGKAIATPNIFIQRQSKSLVTPFERREISIARQAKAMEKFIK